MKHTLSNSFLIPYILLIIMILVPTIFGMRSKGRSTLELSGMITDSITTNPVPAAIVEVTSRAFLRNQQFFASTDNLGTYRIDSIPSGKIEIRIDATGYESKYARLHISEYDTAQKNFKLHPAKRKQPIIEDSLYVCIGYIYDSRINTPVKDARVHSRIAQEIDDSAAFVTTDDGYFHFSFSQKGSYTLFISHPMYHDTTIQYTISDSVPLLKTIWIQRKDAFYNNASIGGTVVDNEGNALDSVILTLIENKRNVYTDKNGRFSFPDLNAGSYAFIASKRNYNPAVMAGIEIDHNDTAHFEVTLNTTGSVPNAMIEGNVTDHENQPLSEVAISVLGRSTVTTSDTTGHFSVSLPPGLYRLKAEKDSFPSAQTDYTWFQPGMRDTITFVLTKRVSNTGILTGQVVNKQSNTMLPGVKISIPKVNRFAITNGDGVFTIDFLKPGEYAFIISHSGFYAHTETITVKKDNNPELTFSLSPSKIGELPRQVVIGSLLQNTAGSLLKKRKESFTISNYMAADEISKSGAGDAASAAKYITGVTIVDGKYVIMRGLGDRYTSISMNGIPLPSPNPDRPAVPMDIFPTSLLDNLQAHKAFTPDLPGNFSGGNVNIALKSIPEKLLFSVSASSGANDQTTFRDDFLSIEKGEWDWLGFDDGTRKLPSCLDEDNTWLPGYGSWIGVSEDSAKHVLGRIDTVAKAFKTSFVPEKEYARPSQSYSVATGNTFSIFNNPFGILGTFTYKSSIQSENDRVRATWIIPPGEPDPDSLICERKFAGTKGTKEVLWAGMINAGYRLFHTTDISGIYMYTRNAEGNAQHDASTFHHQLPPGDTNIAVEHREMRYVQRGLHFGLLRGDHEFEHIPGLKLSGAVAIADGEQVEPDYRIYTNTRRFVETDSGKDTIYKITTGIGIVPSHRYRFTREKTNTFRFDMHIPFPGWTSRIPLLKTGVFFQEKYRAFRQKKFWIENHPGSKKLDECNGDMDFYVAPSNMGYLCDTSESYCFKYSTFFIGNMLSQDKSSDTTASHKGNQTNRAWYGFIELPLVEKLTMVAGTRYEFTKMNVQSQNTADTINSGQFSSDIWLPTFMLNYNVSKDIILRGAYSKTYALPIFREMAPYTSEDPALKEIKMGNASLTMTNIENYDIGIDWYFGLGEFTSIGVFYKELLKPIDLVYLSSAKNREMTWENLTTAELYGLEYELRFGLRRIHSILNGFLIGANVTFLHSSIAVDSTKAELLKELENPPLERPLKDASPYVVNFSLEYKNKRYNFDINSYFNIYGERLVYATDDQMPDSYEYPRPELNINASKKIGSFKIKTKVNNVLNPVSIDGHPYKKKIYKRRTSVKGRSYSVSVSYDF